VPPDTTPYGAVAGRDGNVWIALVDTSGGSLARMTASGRVTTFKVPDGDVPAELVVGPDGALFFTVSGQAKVGRFLSEEPLAHAADHPDHRNDGDRGAEHPARVRVGGPALP
jgi:virginiamycin B lyase